MVIAPKTALVRWMSHFIAADLPRWRTHLRTATLGFVLLALAFTGLSPVRAAEPLREEGDTGLFQRVLTLPDAILRQSPRPDSGILQKCSAVQVIPVHLLPPFSTKKLKTPIVPIY